MEVDFDAGTIQISGPASKKEQKKWNEGLGALRKMRALVLEYRRAVLSDPLNEELQWKLLHSTDRFMRNNDALPERYRMKRLPIWKEGTKLPLPGLAA